MGIFGPKKPKITKEMKEDWTLFNIAYYPSKDPEKYRQALLHKLMSSKNILAVINSRFMYENQKSTYMVQKPMLLKKLESLGIWYKVNQVKRKKERAILGVSVAQSSDATYIDPVIGLVIEEGQMDAVIGLLQEYNVYYYLGTPAADLRETLERLVPSLDHEEMLEKEFSHKIFDDNFIKSVTVYCPPAASEAVARILEEQ